MNYANSSSTMCLANSILLGQVGATCCAATYLSGRWRPHLPSFWAKLLHPRWLHLVRLPWVRHCPFPFLVGLFSHPSKEQRFIMIVGGRCGCVYHVFCVRALGSPSIVTKKVYMHTSTSSQWRQREHDKKENMTDGTNQNMTKRGNGDEQLERWDLLIFLV